MYFSSPCLFDLAIEKVNSGGCWGGVRSAYPPKKWSNFWTAHKAIILKTAHKPLRQSDNSKVSRFCPIRKLIVPPVWLAEAFMMTLNKARPFKWNDDRKRKNAQSCIRKVSFWCGELYLKRARKVEIDKTNTSVETLLLLRLRVV